MSSDSAPSPSRSPSCNDLIRHYARSGSAEKALLLFDRILRQNPFFPDKFTFVNILSVCGRERLGRTAKCVHAVAVITSLDSELMLATSAIHAYGKCGYLGDARKTFELLPVKDVVSWNAVIAMYAQHGDGTHCFELFHEMHQSCVLADRFTFVSMLSACGNVTNLRHGQYMHVFLSHICLEHEVILGTSLLDMYSKCYSIKDARKVFDEMKSRDIASWNAMISGYSHSRHMHDAFYLFYEMKVKGIAPNKMTFVCLVDACANSKSLREGWEIHSHLIEEGFDMDVVVGTPLVNMYCKCYSLNDARRTFDSLPERNLTSWNSMIAGYMDHQHEKEAFEIFAIMTSEGITNPDSITYTRLIEGCAKLETYRKGEHLYKVAIQNRLGLDSSVVASVIKLYGKCGELEKSLTLFQTMPQKSAEVCEAMFRVYAEHGLLTESCELFHTMCLSGEYPDDSSIIDMLSVCGRKRGIQEGKWIHSNVVLHSLENNIFVLNALIDMYGKCCSLEDSCALFDRMLERSSVTWSIMLSAYIQSGHEEDAIKLFLVMKKTNIYLDPVTFVHIIDACTGPEALSEGQNAHTGIVLMGFESDVFVTNTLINMYAKCKRFDDSTWLFENMHYRDIVSWNTMISAYAQQRKVVEMLECFDQMALERTDPDEFTCVSMLVACASPENFSNGKLVHNYVIFSNLESNHAVVYSLTNMYGKCGRLEEAQKLFGEMIERTGVAWNAMIQAYADHGKNFEAFKLLEQMQIEGNVVDGYTCVCLLAACTSMNMLTHGKHLHTCINSAGFTADTITYTALISMYGRCGSVVDAAALFDTLCGNDTVSWNAMIGVILQSQNDFQVFQLFQQMLCRSVIPTDVTIVSVLQMVSRYRKLLDGKRMHTLLIHSDLLTDLVVCNSLLSMYSACKSVVDAETTFNQMMNRDVVSWNTLIKMYIRASYNFQAVQAWAQMEAEGFIPDNVTYISILEACGNLGAAVLGKYISGCIMGSKLFHNTVYNAIVNLYIKYGYLNDAWIIFQSMPERNAASWNAIISGNYRQGNTRRAFEVFHKMLAETVPDSVTFAIILSMCAYEEALIIGTIVHSLAVSMLSEQELLVGNSLINMYGKIGSLRDALYIFETMEKKEVSTWNSMIRVSTLYEQNHDCILLLDRMWKYGVIVNEQTLVIMLDFYTNVGAGISGSLLHVQAIESGVESDGIVTTALLNMYGKCGSLEDARNVFNNISKKDAIAWASIISIYSSHGHVREVLSLLKQMQSEGLVPDEVTLTSILSACSHGGLLEEGQYYAFQIFKNQIDVAVSEHLDCVLDLHARMGRSEEAEQMINYIPFQPSIITWTSFLVACHTANNVHERAKLAVFHMSELDVS